MHDLLDDYANSSALRETSPWLKLLFGLAAIIICVASASPVAPLFIALSMSLITLYLAKIPWRFYSRLLLVPLSFSLLSAIVVAFMHGGGSQLFSIDLVAFDLAIREDGANLALLLVSRTFGGMCSLFFIALTTPMLEVFSIGKSLGLPDFLVELSMLMYRYIFVFLDQAAMIHSAQVMRLGDAGIRSSLRSFSMLSSVLFLRSWEQGERLVVAMDARCYSGKLDPIDQSGKADGKAIFAAIGYIALTASIALLTRDIQLL